ncbi:hypothetical protein [Phaeodactylibacter sp.]|jgi:hypothetical protein|uniref:hypothetical protein n=1 Tax=Phaeodactylibacter sp. TaxID=1940289 RepID=UPI0025D94C29|nr:hypothetical protein [Phaeodactylibacter sp.]MCI4649208.1 hypothetical protein [Phaeodactylibacter sp.]MCI5090347.1 hypothetical protein [Phaeodactylibacter sp.]
MKKVLFTLLSLVLLWSCQTDGGSNLVETDLMEHGVPVTIMAPDSAVVKARNMGTLMKDVTVKGEGNYDLQIMASSATTSDLARVKAEQLATVKTNRYFSRIVSEEEKGFLYEMALDSNNLNYNFRYIHLQGDQEIIFSAGMASTLSQEEAERIYEAVKQ